jgi:hypothetical protein
MRRTVSHVAVLLCVAVLGCRNTEKQAQFCAESTETLVKYTGGADDHWMQLLAASIEVCAAACDGEDKPSCSRLDEHLTKVCGASSSICDKMCTTAESPSLRKASCAKKGGAASDAPSSTATAPPAPTVGTGTLPSPPSPGAQAPAEVKPAVSPTPQAPRQVASPAHPPPPARRSKHR